MSQMISLLLAIAAGGLAFVLFWLENRATSKLWSIVFAALGVAAMFSVFAALVVPNFDDSANAGVYIFMGVLIWVVVIGAASDLFPNKRRPNANDREHLGV